MGGNLSTDIAIDTSALSEEEAHSIYRKAIEKYENDYYLKIQSGELVTNDCME